MERQKRIVAIHDLSGVGKCSLTIALPVISATGVECACMPTAVLSTHTGEFTGYTVRPLTDEMLPMARHWRREGINFDGIYSGYLASPAQEAVLEAVLECLAGPETMVIVDPVMADNGAYYSRLGDEMCQAFRRLCARAEVITPNLTEAALLTGLPYREGVHDKVYLRDLLQGLQALCSGTVAITGVRLSQNQVGNLIAEPTSGAVYTAMRPARPGLFYGTGDLFASALAALLVRGAPAEKALNLATDLVGDAIARTERQGTPRRFGVDFENALPAYIRQVEALFVPGEF